MAGKPGEIVGCNVLPETAMVGAHLASLQGVYGDPPVCRNHWRKIPEPKSTICSPTPELSLRPLALPARLNMALDFMVEHLARKSGRWCCRDLPHCSARLVRQDCGG